MTITFEPVVNLRTKNMHLRRAGHRCTLCGLTFNKRWRLGAPDSFVTCPACSSAKETIEELGSW